MVRTIHGWGYNYFKMDGLWTGTATEQIYVNDGYHDDHIGNNAPFHNPKKTNLEAFRDGLRLLRQAAGPEVFFSGCNVSQNMRTLGGTIGLLDSMRIGPDNGHGWGRLPAGNNEECLRLAYHRPDPGHPGLLPQWPDLVERSRPLLCPGIHPDQARQAHHVLGRPERPGVSE